MSQKHRVVLAPGDGIGPEITDAVVRILEAAEAPLEFDRVDVGQVAYERGFSSGVPDEAWDAIRASGCLLKAPITTPQGKGFKSVNVTLRKTLNLFANIRPCKSYSPSVASAHPGMNLVIVRENEEDLYAGIEHRQTREVTQVLKLITRPGSENIIRYAFEYARAYGRRRVTCMSKDNIMKLTDGLFHQIFDEIAADYPEIQHDHQIIDIGSARLASNPELFDVIVTLNLYGDILSDIAAQLAGSIGFAASANIGHEFAMFEAVHGSAPDIAGKGVANPSGLLIAATQMLVHLGCGAIGETIKNAWLCTLEDGIHTPDVFREGLSVADVGTHKFADAVIERLGRTPQQLQQVHYHDHKIRVSPGPARPIEKALVGVDVFLDWDENDRDPDVLGTRLATTAPEGLSLTLITNRGVKVYPDGMPETFCTDHWRCRFKADGDEVSYSTVVRLLQQITDAGLEVIKTENLYTFDGEPGYSKGQGE
ncbi:MAG: NADP-dependent isocitrate dehydrogenase [Acidobacteriota bacterium]